MNYKPMFLFEGGEEQGNAQVFATESEALHSAAARFNVWTMPIDYFAAETSDKVNYVWNENAGDIRLID
jgi:hypothetical protein